MAKQPANNSRIYLDEFNLSGSLNGITRRVTQEIPIASAFSDAGPRRVVGNYDHEHSALGLFDGTAGEIDAIIHSLLDGSDHYLMETFGGGNAGDVCYDAVVALGEKPLSAQLGGVQVLNFDAMGRGPEYRGLILGLKTSTGAENLTGVNQGTTTSGQVYAVTFRVISFTGTDITLTVEESSDNGSTDAFATISGLTSGSLSAAGVVRVTTTAATEAYKRVAITTSGGFSSAAIVVTAGVETGT